MEGAISLLVGRYESGVLSRRELIQSLGLLVAPQTPGGSDVIKIASIHHVSVQVADMQRSASFYRRVFGLTDRGTDAETVRLASGKCHISIRRGTPIGIDHFCFGMDRLSEGVVTPELKRRGAEPRSGGHDGYHVVDPDGIHVQLIENDQYHR
jgi:catechol 2,3-dioxygenase-like lactoylglutathione lyase family enzyme